MAWRGVAGTLLPAIAAHSFYLKAAKDANLSAGDKRAELVSKPLC